MLETLLGLTLEEGTLKFKPCLPADWEEYTVHYRYGETVYRIRVVQVTGGKRGEGGDFGVAGDSGITVDGVKQTAPVITLIDDRVEHHVEVRVYPLPALSDPSILGKH
jgi:cellobiose phosphorylase